MRNFLIRLVVNALALLVTAYLLPGIDVPDRSLAPLLIIALIFGVVNAILKPIVIILTLPVTLVTLGLFLFVVNGLMLLATEWLSGGRLVVAGLGAAILGGIVMGLAGMVIEAIFKSLGIAEEDRR